MGIIVQPTAPGQAIGKLMFTEEGGIAVKMIAGESLIRGDIVHPTANNTVSKTAIEAYDPCGSVVAPAAAGAEVWIAFEGIVPFLCDDNVVAGDLLLTSETNAGRVRKAATIPPLSDADHFREYGHVTVGATAGNIGYCLIHKN